jgi:hypothetical protein
MLKEVLTATLRPEHRRVGLYLTEDEDFLYLMWEGQDKPLAIWLAGTATVAMVREAADQIINTPFALAVNGER